MFKIYYNNEKTLTIMNQENVTRERITFKNEEKFLNFANNLLNSRKGLACSFKEPQIEVDKIVGHLANDKYDVIVYLSGINFSVGLELNKYINVPFYIKDSGRYILSLHKFEKDSDIVNVDVIKYRNYSSEVILQYEYTLKNDKDFTIDLAIDRIKKFIVNFEQ